MSTPRSSPGESADVSLRFWGVRGSIPSPGPDTARYGGNTACVELRVGREIIILDAGSGLRSCGAELIREAGGNPIDASVLISHTHWDHIQGLPFFRVAYGPENNVRLIGAPGMRAQLQQAFSNQMQSIHFPVPFEKLPGIAAIEEFGAHETHLGEVSVRMIALNHPGGCTGFRVETPLGAVAYLPDHEPYRSSTFGGESEDSAAENQKLVAFLRGCDVLILDSQYDVTEYPERIGWGHGCLEDSVALAVDAGVQMLILFHHDPDHDDAKIDTMVATARGYATKRGSDLEIRAACERELLVLSGRQALAA